MQTTSGAAGRNSHTIPPTVMHWESFSTCFSLLVQAGFSQFLNFYFYFVGFSSHTRLGPFSFQRVFLPRDTDGQEIPRSCTSFLPIFLWLGKNQNEFDLFQCASRQFNQFKHEVFLIFLIQMVLLVKFHSGWRLWKNFLLLS